jgi:hypothetical protein
VTPAAYRRLEAVADGVKFVQEAATEMGFKGKLTDTSAHGIKLVGYNAFVYDKDSKLLEQIGGKHSKEVLPASIEFHQEDVLLSKEFLHTRGPPPKSTSP